MGDLCLIDVESSDIAHTYSKVFQVVFSNGDSEMFETECEPAIREAVERFRRNSDWDSKITAQTLEGGHIQFDCHDVLVMMEVDTASPEYHFLYPAGVRMFEWRGQRYYEVDESNILGVIWVK